MTLAFTGPLLVFGGPYSNLQATRALRRVAEDLGIPADHVVCTGDVVAYCAHPVETVAEIRDWGCHVVMGNCEESLAEGAEDCGCGFEEGTACDLLSRQWFAHASARLGADDCRWMGALPRAIDATIAGHRLTFLHGGATEINRFVFASQPEEVFAGEMQGLAADIVIGGHCGLPFRKPVGDRLWLNAGVIGMPANDGTPDAHYMLVTPEDGAALKIEFHRLAYDHAAAAAAMRAEGLAEGYAAALSSGLWPSLDVLPAAEKQATGRRLDPQGGHWPA